MLCCLVDHGGSCRLTGAAVGKTFLRLISASITVKASRAALPEVGGKNHPVILLLILVLATSYY